MTSLIGRPTQDRYDRNVRRARILAAAGAPRHRLAFSVEEALRLASLPGEDEGRCYFFRRLRVSGLPPDGDRAIWLDRFQRTLNGEASRAVHGPDRRAAFASVVFFRNQPEALEILLHRILDRRPKQEWFWPMVMAEPGSPSSTTFSPSAIDVIEKLQAQPASWVAVASALFALPSFDVPMLLTGITASTAQKWLREMDGPRPLPTDTRAEIPPRAQPAIDIAVRAFGMNDATLWLAAVAVLLDFPADLAARTNVWRARLALQSLAPGGASAAGEIAARGAGLLTAGFPAASSTGENASPAATFASPASGSPSAEAPVFAEQAPDSEESPSAVNPPTIPDVDTIAVQESMQARDAGAIADLPSATIEAIPFSFPPGASAETVPPIAAAEISAPPEAHAPDAWQWVGLPTTAAGLFFLLNALQRIGISQAIEAGLTWSIPNFVPRVVKRLATHAGIGAEDPIVTWLQSLDAEMTDEGELLIDPSWWPRNLSPSRSNGTADRLVRAWYLGVRRWCWHWGKVSAREIVSRSGVFSVNRTDLNVSLSIDDADVRIRKAGLDLDPGWLPWFGRVVRFHYVFRGGDHG
jgi:hypothetical protein